MKLVKYERVITACTDCIYRIMIPTDVHGTGSIMSFCDSQENPDKPGYARPIPDVSNIPDWCPLEDI